MKIRFLMLVILGGITSFIIYSCSLTQGTISIHKDTICSNYTDVNTLEVKLIHAMTQKYSDKQLDAINTGTRTRFTQPTAQQPEKGDSEAIWFDLETLKAFIYHIENEAKKHPQKPAQSKDLGIRIYYASYPDSTHWGNYTNLPGTGNHQLTNDYSERHTLIMVPTIRRDGIEFDFNPLDYNTYYDGMDLTGIYSLVSSSAFLALTGTPSSGSTGAQNHGKLYPPLGDTGNAF
ncbi:hypothetical protein [Dokdonia pacifica]|uniref:Uncharacterized protein n=1 Tax=Dokdonia pacifica TaxID=1627892 RepID=A0A238W6A1_9FLAO|nr:hypothetical protein [Dokdonia pacifica]SNR41229.1 hypothetical protein SAMN06265376_101667 [Dokdonia pacifica]